MNIPDLRAKKMALTNEEAMALLEKSEYGILSTITEEGQCYGVPLNYVMADGAIFFHGLTGGFKASNIAHNPNVSFTVVGETEVMPDKFDTIYESAIAFGKAEIVADDKEKEKALWLLCEKFSKQFLKEAEAVMERDFKRTMIIKITIAQVTGKANKRK